jgi:serine protease Do/serine protease DegQ
MRSLLSAALLAILLLPIPALARPVGPMAEMMERGSIAPMLEKVLPAIVSVRVKGYTAVEQNPLASHPIFGPQVREEMKKPELKEFTSSGSGVVVDIVRGLVLTNFHVIDKASQIMVVLADGREMPGRLVGRDAPTDVAVLQIDAVDLIDLPIGDSSKVRVGDFVVAIGNPFGLESTATMGIVSTLARSTVGYRDFESYIQHDAAVNSGNSGGALVNMAGELIGINTAILSPSGGSVGLGFAIPTNMAFRVMEQIVKWGRVRRGISGVRLEDVTPALVAEHKLAVRQGAFVKRVQPGSPAEEQGIQPGDVITAVNAIPVRRAADFSTLEALAEIGERGQVQIQRGPYAKSVPLWVAELKPEQDRLEIPPSVLRLAGVVLGTLESDAPLFGEVKGVEVVEVKKGSFAELFGLVAGDIVTAIEQDRVRRPEDVLRLVKDRNAKYDIHVVRKGVPVIVRVPI